MKLIIENIEHSEFLWEANTEGKKYLYIEGIFLQSEIKNRNGRLYPKGVMEAAVADYMPMIHNRDAYGELGHPDGPKINEHLISHLIEGLEWHGNNVNGRAKIIPVGRGAIAQGIIEAGGRLGVSSRGLGSLKNTGGAMQVQGDFKLATAADIVTGPSAPDAFVNGIMEGAEWVKSIGGEWVQVAVSEAQTTIRKTGRTDTEATKLAILESFLNRLKG